MSRHTSVARQISIAIALIGTAGCSKSPADADPAAVETFFDRLREKEEADRAESITASQTREHARATAAAKRIEELDND